MKLLPLSDLHIELGLPPEIDDDIVAAADVVVLAGDIGSGTQGLDWARRRFPGKPLIYVPGNHEYYGHHINKLGLEMRAVARELDIHLLDNDVVTLDGVRFVGATLWTDFELFGSSHGVIGDALQAAKAGIRDFSIITFGTTGWMRPADSVKLHRVSREFIGAALDKAHAGPTVVVTHHLPSFACVSERFRHSLTSAAFASHLDDLVQRADLWICGHTHDRFDLCLGDGKGRIFCNPRGYASIGRAENPDWQPELVTV